MNKKELVSKFIETDYDQYVTMRTFKIKVLDEHKQEQEFMENRYVSVLDKSKPLISPTRITGVVAPVSNYLYSNETFKKSAEFGRELGKALETLINDKQNWDTKNTLLKTIIYNLFNELKTLELTPLKCEKHILKDNLHGFVDMYCVDKEDNLVVLELKTRKTIKDVKNKDFFQAAWYKHITNDLLNDFHKDEHKISAYVVVCSREDGNVKFYPLKPQADYEMKQLINSLKWVSKFS